MVNWEPTGFIATYDVWTLTVGKVWNGWSWAICDGVNESWEGIAEHAQDAMDDAVKCMVQVSSGDVAVVSIASFGAEL